VPESGVYNTLRSANMVFSRVDVPNARVAACVNTGVSNHHVANARDLEDVNTIACAPAA
jgi:hypothetical protein